MREEYNRHASERSFDMYETLHKPHVCIPHTAESSVHVSTIIYYYCVHINLILQRRSKRSLDTKH